MRIQVNCMAIGPSQYSNQYDLWLLLNPFTLGVPQMLGKFIFDAELRI
jgi:hypothetical protein